MIFELVKLQTWRDNIWMQIHGAERLPARRTDGCKIEVNSTRGRLGRPHALLPANPQLHEPSPSRWRSAGRFPATSSSAASSKPTTARLPDGRRSPPPVKPGKKAELLYEVLQHQGRNAKQNNVTVEEAEVKP